MEIVLIKNADAGKQYGEIKKAIDAIARTGKKLDADIHTAAVSCLNHAEQHGDVTLCTRLVNAMPKSSRRKALVVWFVKFGPLAFNEKEKAFKVAKGKEVKQYDIEAAAETPFFDLTAERNPEPYTLDKLVGFIKRKIEEMKEKETLKEGDLAVLKQRLEESVFTA